MIQSIRVLWKGLGWNQPINFGWSAITADSVVHISVSEARQVFRESGSFGSPLIDRFLGDARIEVRNISPRAGGVNFFVYIDWDEPLDITTDITVFDPPVILHLANENQSFDVATQRPLGTRSQKFLLNNLDEVQLKKFQELMFKESLTAAKITASRIPQPSKPEKKLKKKKKP